MSHPASRPKPIRVGSTVRILRQDIWAFRNHSVKRRPRGIITEINGGYIYVRPTAKWWKGKYDLELYDCEIEVIS